MLWFSIPIPEAQNPFRTERPSRFFFAFASSVKLQHNFFCIVANTDTTATGSGGGGGQEAGCLPVAQLFTKRKVLSLILKLFATELTCAPPQVITE